MVTVMLAMIVLTLLGTAAIGYGVGSQNLSRYDQDWNGALAAAEAGIDDYVFRINENGSYHQYSESSPDPANGAFTGFVTIPGEVGDSQYQYDVDTSSLATDGTIELTSTGRVRDSERTVQTVLRRRSFIDYLYFTEYETVDPVQYTGSGGTFTAATAQTRCARHYYGGFGVQRDVVARTDYAGDTDPNFQFCTDINFVTADAINGPLHTNDAFLVCGSPDFNGPTSTSWTGDGTNLYRVNGSCGAATPSFAEGLVHADPLTMPPSNTAVKAETAPATGGCLYTGPTRIRLLPNGTMDVKSPFSKDLNGDTNPGNDPPCPTNGNGQLPPNGVIYVQSVPSVASDPNYTAGCPYTVNGRNHPLGFPISEDITTYQCRVGDAFIEGTLDSTKQLTVAAENDVVVTWDLEYENGVAGTSLQGLIANNDVEIYHPVDCTSGCSESSPTYVNLQADLPSGARFTDESNGTRTTPFDSPDVDAAILSVNHSFRVQNYQLGSPLGTLHITGAIAQRYRGAVGTTSGGSINHGYAKDYVYDQRLRYLSPPKFLDPVAAAWGVATWAELSSP